MSLLNKEKLMKMKQRHQGFTLLEMAVVLVIVGLLMTAGVQLISGQMTSAQYSATRTKQDAIKQVLINYFRTKGHLPCPDVAASPTGAEPASCIIANADGYGVLPWVALGITRDTVVDGFGNYFTYRVANGKPSGVEWTPTPATATTFSINELKTPTDAITIREPDASNVLANVTTKAVAVVYSHGKNGYGAITSSGSLNASPPGSHLSETTNNASGTLFTFDVRAVSGEAFDDVVTYLLPQDLLQPLVTEGTLKSCYAYCAPSRASACLVGGGTCSCAGVSDGATGTLVGPCTSCDVCVSTPATIGCSASGIPFGWTSITCL